MARIAQLVRALGCGPRSPGFKSRSGPSNNFKAFRSLHIRWEVEVMGGTLEEMMFRLVLRLECLYLKIPYSIKDKSLEDLLSQLSSLLRYRLKQDYFIKRPYSGLDYEALMLSDLSKAIRIRMEVSENTNISGIDYLAKRLEEFLESMRGSLGYNPSIPLNLFIKNISIE